MTESTVNPGALEQGTITQALAQQRRQAVELREYHLHLDVRGAGRRTVDGDNYAESVYPVQSTLVLRSARTELIVDYLGADVTSVRANGAAVDFTFDGAHIVVKDLPVGEDVRLEICGMSTYSRTGQGLHRMFDTADGNTYLYSHLEPSDARRVFPCIDQPDLKATFHVKLTGPAEWVFLSNQPEIGRDEVGGEEEASASDKQSSLLATVTFAPTPLLSTYLTAFAAGPYVGQRRTWTASDGTLAVELGAWARASMADYVDDEILDITAQGLDFYHQAYGYPYPWGKYDSIFVPEYNLGAMENPGLVTFTEAYLFRSTPTRAQHAGRTNTILHEMAHMWFGDLVTPLWWDDLWLKESFAEFMGADAAAHATDYTENWTNFAATRKNWAYAQDQLPTTHPIKADIPDVDAARQNFDGITYAKGAAVLKQLVHFVGREEFYAGARDYFHTHAFGAATFADLVTALKKHTDRDLDTWSNAWLRTTGVDTIMPIVTDVDGRVETLTLEVTSLGETRPHRINVSFFADSQDADGTVSLERTDVFDVDIPAGKSPYPIEVPAATGAAVPALVLVNDGDHTYAKVRFDKRSLGSIEKHLQRIGTCSADGELSRAVVWTALWNMTRDGVFAARDYVDIVLRHATAETNSNIVATALGNAAYAVAHYIPDENSGRIKRDFARSLWDLLNSAEAGSDQQLVLARAAIRAQASSPEEQGSARLQAILRGDVSGLAIDPDIRWSALSALAAREAVTAEEIDAELRRDNTLTGAARHLQARYSWPRPETKAEILNELARPGAYSNAEIGSLLAAFNAPGSKHLRQEFAPQYFHELDNMWHKHPIEIARKIVAGLYPEQEESLAATDAYLNTGLVPAALRRELMECRDTVARNLRVQRAQAELV